MARGQNKFCPWRVGILYADGGQICVHVTVSLLRRELVILDVRGNMRGQPREET